MKIKSWSHQVAIAGCLLMTTGCATTGKDGRTTILPNLNGDGVRAEIEIEYESVKELPKKLVSGLGSALVSITQPVHPYHKGKSGKVWFPFWRIIGEHHGDSVAGIIYDHGWFGGWREYPGNKLGKTAGLLLLIWASDSLTDDSNHMGVSTAEEYDDHTVKNESHHEVGPIVPGTTTPGIQVDPPETPPVVPPTVLLRTGGRVGQ